jgi:hypothetical protein
MLSASELAAHLGVTKGRVSQLVAKGALDGCWEGEGRGRRFDLAKCAMRLDRKLDRGQMLGNGAATRAALRTILSGPEADSEAESRPAAPDRSKYDGALPERDADRYDLARTQKAEEEVRKLRRDNEMAAGTLVKASEVKRQVSRLIAQEIAEFETVLRDGARRIADKLGVDYKVARQLLTETWRAHRGGRSTTLSEASDAAVMTEAEGAADI